MPPKGHQAISRSFFRTECQMLRKWPRRRTTKQTRANPEAARVAEPGSGTLVAVNPR